MVSKNLTFKMNKIKNKISIITLIMNSQSKSFFMKKGIIKKKKMIFLYSEILVQIQINKKLNFLAIIKKIYCNKKRQYKIIIKIFYKNF